jgi:hypothetical protein
MPFILATGHAEATHTQIVRQEVVVIDEQGDLTLDTQIRAT